MRSNQLSYLAIGTQWGPVAPAVRAPKGNRTLDLLLTMETLCRLSYRGNEPNPRQIRIALAIRSAVASLTAVLAGRRGAIQVIAVAGEGFEPP